MKIFHKEENGKEVVFVQERDVFYFIRENRKIPSIILEEYYKDGVKPVDADLSEFIKLDSEEAVRFFKEKDYIIDYDQYKDFTVKQLERKIKKTDKETQKLEKKIKNYAEAGEDIDKIANFVRAVPDEFINEVKNSSSVAVTYYPEINRYQGRETLQIVIRNYLTE